MTHAALAIASPPTPSGGRRSAFETARVRALALLLENPFLEAGQVRSALEELTPSELRAFGYDSYYMNALMLFGATHGAERVHRIAAAATRAKLLNGWEAEARYGALRRGFEDARRQGRPESLAIAPALEGWEAVSLPRIPSGVGYILALFHLPGYRYTGTDLAFAGHTTRIPMMEEARERISIRYFAGFPDEFHARCRLLSVEQRGATFTLAKALRKGELVTMFADGNLGADGSWDTTARTKVRFLNEELYVKNGIPRLAIVTGAPVVPVITRRRAGGGYDVSALPTLVPPERSAAEAGNAYVATVMQTLYGALAAEVERTPAEWESLCHIHRWRIARAPQAGPDSMADRVLAGEEDSWRVRFDTSRVADLSSGADLLFVDVQTMSGVRPPSAAEPLFRALGQHDGVTSRWLDQHADSVDRRAALLAALGTLSRRGLLMRL